MVYNIHNSWRKSLKIVVKYTSQNHVLMFIFYFCNVWEVLMLKVKCVYLIFCLCELFWIQLG